MQIALSEWSYIWVKNLNPTRFVLWTASHFAPLLVIWSPWVNGFTLSCFCFFPCVLALPFICFPSEHVNFYFIFFHILHRITLEIMTLQPKCDDVETAEGVAITVTGVAQVNHHTFLGMPAQTLLTHTPLHPSFLWHHPIISAKVVFYTEGSS